MPKRETRNYHNTRIFYLMKIEIKGGDKNTKFFHRMANAYKRVNLISKLKMNRIWFFKGGKYDERNLELFFNALLETP